ncbi:MAG: MFS transporter [Gemmataceae bacterium]
MASADTPKQNSSTTARTAFTFVVCIGTVSLLADMTYEGGASINGQFLGGLGASAATISIVAGLGEFLGYALRSVSGYVSDKSRQYWLITFLGYGINLLAVPAMALAGNWQVAAALLLAERIGRAIRKPNIEAMLSYTTGQLGRGWVYGLHTAMDETGATLGPLLMALAMYQRVGYRASYVWLLAPAFAALIALTVARIIFPVPARLQAGPTATATGFTRPYWLYMLAASCFGAGLMSFEFIANHLANSGFVPDYWVPIMIAIATVASIASSLILGRLFDRVGLPVIFVAIPIAACFSPLVFYGGFNALIVGMIFWGVGYSVQDSLLKAIIAGLLPEGRRSLAFGLFYTGYGVAWLIGSVVTGLLYEWSRPGLIAFAIGAQLASLPIFAIARRAELKQGG